MACCQRGEFTAPRPVERVRGDDERIGLLLNHGCERCIKLAFVAGPKDRHFLPERTGSRLCGAHFDLAAWMVWIHEISDGGSLRHELVHQLHSLSHRCWTKYGDYGDLSAYKLGCQLGKSIILASRSAVFDRHVLPLDKAGFPETLAERSY